MPGNDANPGTQAAPKRVPTAAQLNALPAGATVLLARGGAWNISSLRLDNRNVTSAAPLTIGDYGSGPLPTLNTPSGTALEFGMYGNTVVDGGYVFRNLKLDGRGTGQWGAFVQGSLRDVVFDGVEITGFDVGIHAQQGAATRTAGLTIKNSILRGNREHGFLGDADGLLIENSLIEGNNPSGGGFEHGVYIGGSSSSFTVRNNIFRRNSVNAATGRCDGGNLTIHGAHQSVLIEGNLIEQDAADGGCYGISLTASYSTAEFFRNAVVRNNTIVNVGNCAMCISAAPGVLVEGNKVYNTLSAFHIGVIIPGSDPSPEDAQDGGAIIRNNLVCHTAPASGSMAVRAPSAASVTGNTYMTGAAATTGVCAR